MEDDKIRKGEDDFSKIRETQKESEKRMSEAKDFKPDLLKTRETGEQKNAEAMSMREGDYNSDIRHIQEKRLEDAKNIKDSDSKREVFEAREKRSELIEQMVQNDFPIGPEKRLDNSRDFRFADNKEFAQELKQREPFTTEKDVRLTDGFYDPRDNQAFIKDKGDTLVASIHEKLHQKSSDEIRKEGHKMLNEGITEYFTRQEAGAMGELKKIDDRGREIPKPAYYEKEVDIVRKLEATVGREPLNAAYFEGKTEALKNEIDKYLGDGAFQKISDALENRDYKSASELIEKYYKR